MNELFLKNGKEKYVKQGEVFQKYGQSLSGDSIFFVKSGKVLQSLIVEGDEKYTETLTDGRLVGVIEAMGDVKHIRILSAQALEDTTLYGWTKDEFENLLEVSVDLSLIAISSLSKTLRVIHGRLSSQVINQK